MCHCGKKYKTKGGLERHRAAKHSQNSQAPQLLTQSVLMEIVSTAIQKIKESKVFSEGIRSELSLYQYEVLEEGSEEFKNLKSLFEGHMKNSHVEKFYGKYYGTVPLNSARYFKGLSRNCATLLSTKVADCMLAFCKKEKSVDDSCKESTVTKLSDREKAGLQYVGGYVMHNLHKKHSIKKTSESQEAMAILKAGKLEATVEKQKLISALNRGGLWSITEATQKIFLKTEHYFRHFTSGSCMQKIDTVSIIQKSLSDSDVLSYYELILSDAELVPERHVSKDILRSMVILYVRVRAFSLAKDLIQRYKMKAKQTKAKSLRKEISRSCQIEEPRHD